VKGARYIVHAAADYRLWARAPAEIINTNVEGTRIVMQEALRAGVERIVYTSSVATIDLKAGAPSDESHPLAEDRAIGAYKKSKVIAERMVEDMVQTAGLPAVIVNPSTPIGPRDVRPTPTGRIIVEAARGHMPGFVDTGLNFVHVDDVAAGHLAALRRGVIGERYILGGENVYLRSMLAEIARMMGRRSPALRFPIAAVYPLAVGAEFLSHMTGREPFVTRDALRMARHHMFFDDAKARRELAYRSRPIRRASPTRSPGSATTAISTAPGRRSAVRVPAQRHVRAPGRGDDGSVDQRRELVGIAIPWRTIHEAVARRWMKIDLRGAGGQMAKQAIEPRSRHRARPG